ncbi:MAG: DUF2357 domain-containing protein [Tissierellia bacterium]|nr:DUF2357 domain-containing protein [Tissierellia bacterium]
MILDMEENGKYDIFHAGIRITDDFQIVGNCYIGIIGFSSDIGYTDIAIYKDNEKVLTITLEIFPSKLDYHRDYKELIQEINEEISSLAFQFIDKTYLAGKLKDVDYQTRAEFINILDIIFDDLERSIQRIVSNFKHNVFTQERIMDTHRARRISNRSRSYIRKHPELLTRSDAGFINIDGNGYYPLKVVEQRKNTTIDIFENRFVKYMIERIISRLDSIERIVDFGGMKQNPYIDILRKRKGILEGYIKRHFKDIGNLTGKKSMSLVFQMAPGYREMYKKYFMLQKGLDLGEDLFRVTPKKLYDLYEIWCYIKIHNILTKLGYDVEEYGILQYRDTGMHLSLLQSSEAKTVYKSSKNRLELWYNKFYSSPTTNQRPDTVLHIRNIDGMNDRTYIFDAKYRLSIGNDGDIGPMEEDVNVMHRYRDAIVSKMGTDFKYKYETFGAYVMFPYGDEERFRDHRFFKSIEEVNVGAFPMLPGSTKLIEEHLGRIINQSDLEAKSKRIIVDEYDDYAKFKVENVMVVNVKDRDHMQAYMDNNFYHIPVKRLSNIRLGVEYIAFYQSKASFGEEAGIRYFAKIEGVEKYRRGECREILAKPGMEGVLYLRLNLKNIKRIRTVEPIQSGTRLVSYTTLYLLKNAENMHELKLRSNLEIEVYKVLKRISDSRVHTIRKEFGRYIIGDNKVEVIDGKAIRVNGRISNLRNLERTLDS